MHNVMTFFYRCLEGKKGSMLTSKVILRACSTGLGAESHPEKLEVVEQWDEDE